MEVNESCNNFLEGWKLNCADIVLSSFRSVAVYEGMMCVLFLYHFRICSACVYLYISKAVES